MAPRRFFSSPSGIWRIAAKVAVAVVLLPLAQSSGELRAQARRALLVGINQYEAPKAAPRPSAGKTAPAKGAPVGRGTWRNLQGAINDVEAFKQILISRYQFEEKNIVVLRNAEATRDAILAAYQRVLIDEAQKGDVGVFFYAGHGSQVMNSKSDERDQMDESLVPADSRNGAKDIRDKELSRLFNQSLDKGVILTAIIDSCHSGSIARGIARPGMSRNLPPDPRDAVDPPTPGPAPEERGALIFSAAQDTETANEQFDEKDHSHGVFSLALRRVLDNIPINASAREIFASVKSLMEAEGQRQEPVLAGTTERRQAPLFGVGTSTGSGRTRVAVLRVNAEDNVVELRGGYELGLGVNTELQKVTAKSGEPKVRLRVTEEPGITSSKATVIEGKIDAIAAGTMFEVDRWVSPTGSNLRVWKPAALPYATLQSTVQALSALRTATQIEWVEDPTRVSPSYTLSWEDASWKLFGPGGQAADFGKAPTAQSVLAKLTAEGKEKPRLFVYLPPAAEMDAAIHIGAGSENDSIEVTSKDKAHYFLVGHASGDKIEYAWALPNETEETKSDNSPMPVRSDWFEAGDTPKALAAAGGELQKSVLGIGKVRAWLTLEPPPDDGAFPYRLAFKKFGSDEAKTTGPFVKNEVYGVVLRADPEALKRYIERRYAYLFSIDAWGKSTLLFPRSKSSVENRVPYEPNAEGAWPAEIPLGPSRLFSIGGVLGVDTYILLVSEQAIPDPTVLEFEGVRTRGERSGAKPGLEGLLTQVGAATRGPNPVTPTNWSIQRISIRSVEKAPAQNKPGQ